MAVKHGLGRGLNGAGKGIDSLIAPRTISAQKKKESKERESALQNGTERAGKEIKDQKKNPDPDKKEMKKNGSGEKAESKGSPAAAAAKKEASDQTREIYIKVSDIEPNRQQPRKIFDEDALLELADSIRQYGVLSPILVQKSGDYYEIVAGERRWRAAKLAGLKEIPVIIRKYSPQEIMEISLIENIQRENLNPIEEAQAFKRLLTEFGLKQDELAERVSKSRTAVTNSLRLLKLDERVQQMVIDEMISSGHARALLSVEDGEQQYTLAQKVFDEKLSVRDTEKLVKNMEKKQTNVLSKRPGTEFSFIYRDLEERITGVMGTKVSIHEKNDQKGKIEIAYHSSEELERITEFLLSASAAE